MDKVAVDFGLACEKPMKVGFCRFIFLKQEFVL